MKNSTHYRDHAQTIIDREARVAEVLGGETGARVCALLKTTNPKIYKDQLYGLLKVIRPYSKEKLEAPFLELSERSQLKVSFIRDYLRSLFSSKEHSFQRQRSERGAGELLSKYGVLTECGKEAYVVAG